MKIGKNLAGKLKKIRVIAMDIDGVLTGGFVLSVHSDLVLRSLRKPGEKGYLVPRKTSL